MNLFPFIQRSPQEQSMSFKLLNSPSLFLFHMNLIILIGSITRTQAFSNETDYQALIAIRNHIREDPLKILGSWNQTTHFCNWQGITCSLRHQRVTVLNLSSSDLSGSLSPHIGNLTFLKAIILEDNLFQGMIPQEIGRLFRLEYLSLYTNRFQGEFPTNLSHCRRIRLLDVFDNGLRGKIPIELSTLPNLVELQMGKNKFHGEIPPSYGNLSALTTLTLSNNDLQGEVPFEFIKLSKLEYLELSINRLSGTIPFLLYNISSIQYLAFATNSFHGTLPPDLGSKLPNLEAIFFGGNNFSGPIPPSIANASGLTHFDIGMNSFTGPIPLNLGSNLQSLQLVNFEDNPLGSNTSDDLGFIRSLTNCSELRVLHLQSTNLRGVLPDSISNLSTTLTSLRLDDNFISGSIPDGIGNLFNLETLAINQNMLTGSIPNSIGKITKMQELYLSKNELTGEIPFSAGNFTLITILSMRENFLTGSIPSSMGNCKNLQGLDLSSNQLDGSIPEQLMGISSFSIGLNLSRNQLTGHVPDQVGALINLGRLDISDNRLSGTISSSIGNCLVLELLDMKGNRFEGTIPSTFEDLRGLQYLDLSNNNLSGQIPRFLSGLTSLKTLNLSFNKFEGAVPNEGVFTNASAFSVLGNNNLCGGIKLLSLPPCPSENSARRRRTLILSISIALSIILLLACLCILLYMLKRSPKKQSSSEFELGNQYPTISYRELLQATDGFSPENLIGEGKFGTVYRGDLCFGSRTETVAIKVLKLDQDGANMSFAAECEALKRIRHRNLVKIITSCSSINFNGHDFKALVFEFFPNGSLESWLHPNSSDGREVQKCSLSMIQRLNIAIDMASALDYLHNHCETPVIHCDLKPSNVLLNNELSAHVCDFGLAKILLATASTHNESSSIAIRGTVGYVPPEYGLGREIWAKGDVYSYGILLLEMFTGKRPTDSIFTESFSLHSYVKMSLTAQVMEIIDAQLILEEKDKSKRSSQSSRGNTCEIEECWASVLRLGVVCSHESPSERMDIKDVVAGLHIIRNACLERERAYIR